MGHLTIKKIIIGEVDYKHITWKEHFEEETNMPNKRYIAENQFLDGMSNMNSHVITITGPGVRHHLYAYWQSIAKDPKMEVSIVERNIYVYKHILKELLSMQKNNETDGPDRVVNLYLGDIRNLHNYVGRFARFIDADLMSTFSATGYILKELLGKQALQNQNVELQKVFIGTISRRNGDVYYSGKQGQLKILNELLNKVEANIYDFDKVDIGTRHVGATKVRTSHIHKFENIKYIVKGRVKQLDVFEYGDSSAMLTWRIVYR